MGRRININYIANPGLAMRNYIFEVSSEAKNLGLLTFNCGSI